MAWRFSLKMSKQTSTLTIRLWELMKKGHELILISCDFSHQIEKNGGTVDCLSFAEKKCTSIGQDFGSRKINKQSTIGRACQAVNLFLPFGV